MFSELITDLLDCQSQGLVPYIGGDFNCRIGNPSDLLHQSSVVFNINIDDKTNKHGRTFFKDLCNLCNVLPVNCMSYNSRPIDNDFTFYRGTSKSQINFALTNLQGRGNIERFEIAKHDWHLSDHRMIILELNVDTDTNSTFLLARAMDLNKTNHDMNPTLTQFRSTYDYSIIKNNFIRMKTDCESNIQSHLENMNVNAAVITLDNTIKRAHIGAKVKRQHLQAVPTDVMSQANTMFDNFLDTSRNSTSPEEIQISLDRYLNARKKVTLDLMKEELREWNDSLKSQDAKAFWKNVDWKGNYKAEKQYDSPSIQEFEQFYEELYDNKDTTELEAIERLDTDIRIPELDDPITSTEMLDAYNEMKKPGYDYNLPVLGILISHFSVIILAILNAMFFISYPASLAISLLSLIPKKGNLLLTKNYRGIQMMKILACLYDRVITNRLKPWLKFHIDQTAFQALKSTLIHIFTIRLLIALVKKRKKVLYIASMDIEKALDSVSRYLLLQKLIKIGISKCMLACLKALYSYTMCIIKFKGCISGMFRMLRGIRQGAPSSVLLFNAFIDGLFKYLEERCEPDEILNNIHTLIHADDTIVISTNRKQFIDKCNLTIRFFYENKLKMNKGKLWFTVINSNDPADKNLKFS